MARPNSPLLHWIASRRWRMRRPITASSRRAWRATASLSVSIPEGPRQAIAAAGPFPSGTTPARLVEMRRRSARPPGERGREPGGQFMSRLDIVSSLKQTWRWHRSSREGAISRELGPFYRYFVDCADAEFFRDGYSRWGAAPECR